MPLVDLDDPAELRARWSALAAVAHATGFDRRWYADDGGWYHQDETGSDLRMVRLDRARAVLFGFHTQHSATAGADLLAGSPEWIGQPEVKQRMAAGQLGFVYGSFNGTWARAAYPGDPWQPLDDGFTPIAEWCTSDEAAARELIEWAAEWADYLGALDEVLPVGIALIRTAGSAELSGEVLRELFERLGIGPRSPQDPDLRAALLAAAEFGEGIVAPGAVEALGRNGRMSAAYGDAPTYAESVGHEGAYAEADTGFVEPVEYDLPEEELFVVPPGVSPFTGQLIDGDQMIGEPLTPEPPITGEPPVSHEPVVYQPEHQPEPAPEPRGGADGYGVTGKKSRRFGRKKRHEEGDPLAMLGLVGPAEPEQGEYYDQQGDAQAYEQGQYGPEDYRRALGDQGQPNQQEQAQYEEGTYQQKQPEQAQYEQGQPEQAQHEQGQYEQAQYEPGQYEQAQPEQAQYEQPQDEQAQYEQPQDEQAQPQQPQYELKPYQQAPYGQYDDESEPEQYLGDRRLPATEPPRVGGPVEDGEDYYASLFADAPAAASYTPDVPTDVAAAWSADAPSPFTPLINPPTSDSDDTGVLPPVEDTPPEYPDHPPTSPFALQSPPNAAPPDHPAAPSPFAPTAPTPDWSPPGDDHPHAQDSPFAVGFPAADEADHAAPDWSADRAAQQTPRSSPFAPTPPPADHPDEPDPAWSTPGDEHPNAQDSPFAAGFPAADDADQVAPDWSADNAAQQTPQPSPFAPTADHPDEHDPSWSAPDDERPNAKSSPFAVGFPAADEADQAVPDWSADHAARQPPQPSLFAPTPPPADHPDEHDPAWSTPGDERPSAQDSPFAAAPAEVDQATTGWVADGAEPPGQQTPQGSPFADASAGEAQAGGADLAADHVEEWAAEGPLIGGLASADEGATGDDDAPTAEIEAVVDGVEGSPDAGASVLPDEFGPRGQTDGRATGGDSEVGADGAEAAARFGVPAVDTEADTGAQPAVAEGRASANADDTAALQAVEDDEVEEEYYPTDVSPFASGERTDEVEHRSESPLLANGFSSIRPADPQPGEHEYEFGGEVFHDELIGDGDWTADQLGDPTPPQPETPPTHPENPSPNQPSPDRLPPTQPSHDRLSPERVSHEESSPDQLSPDQLSPDQLPPDQLPPEQLSRDESSPGQLSPGQLPPDQLSPDEFSPGQLSYRESPDQLPSDQTPRDGSSSDQLSPEQLSPDQLAPGQVSSGPFQPTDRAITSDDWSSATPSGESADAEVTAQIEAVQDAGPDDQASAMDERYDALDGRQADRGEGGRRHDQRLEAEDDLVVAEPPSGGNDQSQAPVEVEGSAQSPAGPAPDSLADAPENAQKANTLQTGFPESAAPETGTPETGFPESGAQETGTPGTGFSGSGAHETGTLETGFPESGAQETTPETGFSEPGVREAGTPESDFPETGARETDPLTGADADALGRASMEPAGSGYASANQTVPPEIDRLPGAQAGALGLASAEAAGSEFASAKQAGVPETGAREIDPLTGAEADALGRASTELAGSEYAGARQAGVPEDDGLAGAQADGLGGESAEATGSAYAAAQQSVAPENDGLTEAQAGALGRAAAEATGSEYFSAEQAGVAHAAAEAVGGEYSTAGHEEPERLVAPPVGGGGMAIPGLGLVGTDAPKVEPLPDSIEEAMRSEYERPRPRPKESAALEALREWCRARTKLVPSGFTIQVQVLDPGNPSYRFDLEPPEVDDPQYGADRLAELLGDLWTAESQSEQGAWLFARMDAAGRTLRIDRWYDQVPDWWDHPIEQRLDVHGLVRRLNGRGPDWQPSYLEKLYTTAR